MYKYFLKTFYNRINKNKYKSQIGRNNIRHINIITMKDIIILEKIQEKRKLLKDIANTIALIKIAETSTIVESELN